MEKENKQM